MTESVCLDLSRHCIKTAAKEAYRTLAQRLLTEPRTDQSQRDGLTLLKDFLERTNFRKLRASVPALTGHAPVRIVLERDPLGTVVWRIADDSNET